MRRAALALALFFSAAAGARAGFEDTDVGPRGTGLGGAYTGVARGVEGMAYNAAGLAEQDVPETELSYLRLYSPPAGKADLSDFTVGAAFPSRLFGEGGWGLQWRSSSAPAWLDKEAGLSYGQRGLWSGDAARVDGGARLRLLDRSLDAGGSVSAPSLDLGLTAAFDRLKVGVSVLNANQPGLDAGGVSDRAPRTLKIGAGEELGGILLAVDYANRASSVLGGGGSTFSGGAERWWSAARAGSFAVRTGLSLGDAEKNFALGFAWRRFGAELAYAAVLPFSAGGRIGHAAGLTFRFGGSDIASEYEELLRREIESRKELQRLIDYLGSVLDKMREELAKSEAESAELKRQLASKSDAESRADEKIRALQELQQKIRLDIQEVERRRQEARERAERPAPAGPAEQFQRDWEAYKELAAQGAPNPVLRERLTKLLEAYRGRGVDLGELRRELMRRLDAP